MSRILSFIVAASFAALIAACQVIVVPPVGPPVDAIPTSAGSAGSPRHTVTVPSGGEAVFALQAPGGAADVHYVEINHDLPLELRGSGSGYNTVAFSSGSGDFFGAGGHGLAAAGQLEAQSIGENKACLGSCVIFEFSSQASYARVHNDTGASLAVDLYYYGSDFLDLTEPQNDSAGSAPVLTTDDSGAIETVGDVDFWRMGVGGQVAFDQLVNGIDLKVDVLDAFGNYVETHYGGDLFLVFADELLRVSAVDPQVAAVVARSSYFLELEPAVTPLGDQGPRRNAP